ncbi:MAG: glycosyltransferase family 1 protein [Anaerolineae bacterium]|nr:glycosyltransferase family 4 protein [Thermoflexales bacterium]MDW8407898.1 glycosyltransferase family 1 protein [Anaerolineae bacterium]
MHVVLGAYLLSGTPGYRQAGIHQYSRALIEHLALEETALPGPLTVLISPSARNQLNGLRVAGANITVRTASRSTETPWQRIWVEQIETPRLLRPIKEALYHGLAFVAPLRAPCPTVITVHDLSFITRPQTHKPLNRLYLSLFTHWSCRRATRLIAVSEWTRRDIVRWLNINSEQIEVIPHGVHARFRPLPEQEVAAFKRQHAISDRAIFFLGSLEPRKNLTTLIEAFAMIHSRTENGGGEEKATEERGANQAQLILGGAPAWKYEPIFARVKALALESRVRLIGPIAQEALPAWYNACAVFAYPSLYEGFGLPVLEAMACGAPVVASNVTSLPEVVGDAGLLIDPLDVRGWAEALGGLLNAPERRQALRAASLRRAAAFTWQAAAAHTLKTYVDAWQAGARRL